MMEISGTAFFGVGRFCEAAKFFKKPPTQKVGRQRLRARLEIIFDPVPPGGPRSVVATAMRQTDATERVPPILKHALTGPRLFAVIALLALPVHAAPARWHISDAPYRAVVQLDTPATTATAGIAIAVPEFGATMDKLTDMVLVDAQGDIQPLAPVWRGVGQSALLLAQSLQPNQEYYLYFGGDRFRVGKTWAPQPSLLMETRRLSVAGPIDTWPKMEAAWQAATITDGAGWVPEIRHGANEFGENSRFVTHYTGYLRTDKLKQVTVYTISSDASFVLVNGSFEFGWPGDHPPHSTADTVHAKTITCTGPLTRIDYYHVKDTEHRTCMELGWKRDGKLKPIPESDWVHPGTTKLLRLEQAQGGPVPAPIVHVRSYIGYANQWLYELTVGLRGELPDGWTVQWKFTDGTTSARRELTHIVIGGNTQSVAVKLQSGRTELNGIRSVNFVEHLPAASVKDPTDLHRYLDAMTRENTAELPGPVLRGYLQFFQSVEQEPLMSRLAEAWLKKNPDLNDSLWLPAQLSRLRTLAQTEPARALTELRGVGPAARAKYAAALDLLELDLLVFHLNDVAALARASEIAMRDPKSDTARLAQVRAGDYFRLQGRYPEAIERYQQAQRSVVEDSAGRKLPAQDQAFAMTLEDLLSRDEVAAAEQKLTEWEARHPLAKLDSDFLIWRGRVLLVRSRPREALAEIESFEKLLPESPYQIDADYYRAQALFALGRQAEARTIWAEIAKKYPQHALAASSSELSTKK